MMLRGYEYRERGWECECSACKEQIEEDEPRYNPSDITKSGRLCVDCYEEKGR